LNRDGLGPVFRHVVEREGGASGDAAFPVVVPRRRLGMVVPAVAGVMVIAALAWRMGTSPFLVALSSVTAPALGLALLIGAGTTALSALRWTRAARLLRLSLTPRRALKDYYAAIFLNAVLPAGVLGDVRRAAMHGREAGTMRRATAALLLERSAGQVVLGATAGVVWLDPGWPMATTTMAGLVAAAALRRPRLPLRAIWDAVILLGASVAVLAGHLAMFVLAARTAGVDVPVATLVPPALVALLAMTLPLSLGGWGPREGVTAWAFAGAGLGAERGVSVAVLYGLFALVASLPGVLALVRTGVFRRQGRVAQHPAGQPTVACAGR
jgi:uncharacterized membrane protein YbhN (UPF0104 family)